MTCLNVASCEIWKSPEDGLWRAALRSSSGGQGITSNGYTQRSGAQTWVRLIVDGTFERVVLMRAYGELL